MSEWTKGECGTMCREVDDGMAPPSDGRFVFLMLCLW